MLFTAKKTVLNKKFTNPKKLNRMKILGKLIEKGVAVTGTSEATGNQWSRIEFVVECISLDNNQYYAFSTNRADIIEQVEKMSIGSVVEVNAVIECTKYEKGWFTKLRAISFRAISEIMYNSQQTA